MTPSHLRRLSASARRSWKRRARPVLDLTARRTYPTQIAAAEALDCSPALVCHVLAGRMPAAKGHRLRWLDECPDANVE